MFKGVGIGDRGARNWPKAHRWGAASGLKTDTMLAVADAPSKPFPWRKPDESQEEAGERISEELQEAADAEDSDGEQSGEDD